MHQLNDVFALIVSGIRSEYLLCIGCFISRFLGIYD